MKLPNQLVVKLKRVARLSKRFVRRQVLEVKTIVGLPEDFDGNVYLKLHPDVKRAGLDPAEHYLNHGRAEGRRYVIPALDVFNTRSFTPEFETVLLVSHEASITGAPILSFNLVLELSERFNVVVLLLGGGPLEAAFQRAGAAVVTSPKLRGHYADSEMVVEQLCERFKFQFALVNSIESRVVVPALAQRFIPVISLIHEFASYTRPREAFGTALFWSTEVVFSTNITLNNAFEVYPHLSQRATHVLPQGRCRFPLDELEDERADEAARIRALVRPKGLAEDAVIILGAGSVQYRKGVDLFIECAARVVQSAAGGNCHFVWIGHGYDPENDVGYSVYLDDQVRRAGLKAHITFIGETPAIDAAYEEADILLLSSRLDPLPNVAIDAMSYALPVLCFEKTTGISDFLKEAGLANHCVAHYLDTSDMANKVLELASSPRLLKDVGSRCKTASARYFNLKSYVNKLVSIAENACAKTQQEQADVQTILSSQLYRQDFACPPHVQDFSIEMEVRNYVRAWASGIGRRKPLPGFNPGIYEEQNGSALKNSDPFADYLRKGQPEGPWGYPVIVSNNLAITGEEARVSPASAQRVALHLHVYYCDLLPEILARLTQNEIRPDLFISVTTDDARQEVAQALEAYTGRVAEIVVVPNCGRDIGPFLTEFGHTLLANYDIIGHLHTKKTVDLADSAVGRVWYKFLLENLLGSQSSPMADTIVGKLQQDPSIGLVFPDDPNIVGLDGNREYLAELAQRLGPLSSEEYFAFPVGTMFWARAEALAPLINLNLSWDDYPKEPLPYDGSMLHALERLFGLSLPLSNLRFASTNVIGITR